LIIIIKQKKCCSRFTIDLIGWDESPTAGDQFVAVKNQKLAKSKAEENKNKLKRSRQFIIFCRVSSMSDMMKLLQEGELNKLILY
jgi:hypothetical protein